MISIYELTLLYKDCFSNYLYCHWHCMQDRDWTEYWRLLFKKVTVDDIKSFEESYKGSEEEKDTLKSAYVDSEGNMDAILEEVYVSIYM